MNDTIVATVCFSFQGKEYELVSTLDVASVVQELSSDESILHRIIARDNGLDTYSYAFEVMEMQEILFSDAEGLARLYVQDGAFDIQGYLQSKEQSNTPEVVVDAIAKEMLGIDDLEQHSSVQEAFDGGVSGGHETSGDAAIMGGKVSQLARHATFRQLQVFECLAEHNSFTKAAKVLNLTQPTVSMQIKKLSEALDIELFEQVGRKVYLTEAGEKLYEAAQTILSSLDVVEDEVNHMKGLMEGQLNMVVLSTVQYLIPRIIKKFAQQYPDISISMRVANKTQLLQRMQENRDDFYILGRLPKGLNAVSTRLVSNPLCFVARADHPLAGKRLRLEDLQDETLLLRESGSGVRSLVEEVLECLDFQFKRRIILGSNEVIRLGLLDNIGIAIVSLPTLLQELEKKEIVLLDVEHFPIPRDWYLTYPKGKVLSQIAKKFIHMLEAESEMLDQYVKTLSRERGGSFSMTERVLQLVRHATFRQMQVFERIAYHKSFTKAAEELHLTQPTVSMQIKKLSEVLEMPLFEQIGRKVYLTEAGEILYRGVDNILSNLRSIEEEINHLKGFTGGSLQIAVISTAQYFMPIVIQEFVAEHPDISVSMRIGNKEQMVQRILQNKDDFYLLGQPPEDLSVISTRLISNPLYFVVNKDHPLAGKSIKLEDLENETFLTRESGSGIRNHVERIFAERGFQVKKQVVLGSNEVIRLGLMQNMGVAVISLYTSIDEIKRGDIVLLDVEGFPVVRNWYLAYPQGKVLSQVAIKFIEKLKKDSKQLERYMQGFGV